MIKIILTCFVALAMLSSLTLATSYYCNRPNEEYNCGSACQRTCATLGQRCPIVNIRCNEGCYCKKGYARDERDVCIPIKQCPPMPRGRPILMRL